MTKWVYNDESTECALANLWTATDNIKDHKLVSTLLSAVMWPFIHTD